MQLIFDRENVEKKFYEFLVQEQNGFCDNKRIKSNIEEILNNQSKFCRLVDIALFRDICNIMKYYFNGSDVVFNSNSNFLFSNYFDNFNGNSYLPIKLECSNGGCVLYFGGLPLRFETTEELRKYLYGLAGFVYQSDWDRSSDSLKDPYVSADFVMPRSTLDICQDLTLLDSVKIPNILVEQKTI